jgi:sensor domain CHASE-containing protein
MIVTGAGVFALLAALFVAAHLVILPSFVELESEHARTASDQVLSAVEDQLSELDKIARDYATWDDTCNFLRLASNDYIESNYTTISLHQLDVDIVLIAHTDGRLAFSTGLEKEKAVAMLAEIMGHPSVIRAVGAVAPPFHGLKGLMRFEDKLLLIAARPVVTSEGEGPPQGLLLMSRFLTDSDVERVKSSTSRDAQLIAVDEAGRLGMHVPAGVDEEQTVVEVVNSSQIAAYAMLNDIHGVPVLLSRTLLARDISRHGRVSRSTCSPSADSRYWRRTF